MSCEEPCDNFGLNGRNPELQIRRNRWNIDFFFSDFNIDNIAVSHPQRLNDERLVFFKKPDGIISPNLRHADIKFRQKEIVNLFCKLPVHLTCAADEQSVPPRALGDIHRLNKKSVGKTENLGF